MCCVQNQKKEQRNARLEKAERGLQNKQIREKLCFSFADVAIGAPQEDELKGAVYIYNGRRDGISPTPSQVRPSGIFFKFKKKKILKSAAACREMFPL